MYNGQVLLYNYQTSAIIKTFEITDVPIRACRFIARKNWFVCGSDDFMLRCFNFNTGEKVIQFEAHPDYIRCLAVHPTLPLVLSGSDDMTIRCWNFDQSWKLQQTFEGHAHYVMSLAFNPKDTNTFASSCLDKTVKTWSIGSPRANFTLDAHDRGVNYVDYYPQNDKPYMITTGDDKQIKIWDYQTKACVQILEGHTSNVSFAVFHPEIPVIVSGSEDGTIKIWHSGTYRLEQTLSYGLERAWCVGVLKGRNDICMGFDEGCVVLKMGREEPAVSMDAAGKLIWSRGTEIQTAIVKAEDEALKDGERLSLTVKDLGACEVYPAMLQHSPNGRFVVVCGDGEYILYTALAWRNKAFGAATQFVWSVDSNEYAIREANGGVKVFKQFRERVGLLDLGFACESLFGGQLLGVSAGESVSLFDWTSGQLVRRIDVAGCQDIFWSEEGDLFALCVDDAFYVLRFDRAAYDEAVAAGTASEDDAGVEDAFEVIATINERVVNGRWAGDCFIYADSANRLQYLIGDQTHTVSHFDGGYYFLGYIPRDGRVYLADKDMHVVGYKLSLELIQYQTLITRGEEAEAAEMLATMPEEEKPRIARFLESRGLKDLALSVTTDPEQRFELALSLGQLETASAIAEQSGSEAKWKVVGDAALSHWDFALAERCFTKARDLPSLLLLHSATGHVEGLEALAEDARKAGLFNIAFAAQWSTGDAAGCVSTLKQAGREAEACLLARAYAPASVSSTMEDWRQRLVKDGRGKIAERLMEPEGLAEAETSTSNQGGDLVDLTETGEEVKEPSAGGKKKKGKKAKD
ncbi:putative COPI vesicle coat beta [Protomyces lactucae-debilis]|uniref:Coatomer subunit beta' n=1 Tax=Protomyces lactucae-debilis TaxID=2754530 RepID=A0A1Y2FDR5_PROLT|nr:putative COPI vesicle coat beta [Protomyces lactucae-debilis]ORY80985.1 putative COPI vesicle coat beta [Protomyces lactucae-debilis]